MTRSSPWITRSTGRDLGKACPGACVYVCTAPANLRRVALTIDPHSDDHEARDKGIG